ncbi:AAA family ATPase [Rhizobium sp. KVB221]|uniref:AAA family ATPase n=1 Tax=Rhizobium setariae TaxID=2801340 RepID=A0A936YQ02_9HYPH|nr:AAA family ATPase [Rhizobium setariae]
MSHLAPIFRENAIDIDVINDLSAEDLVEMGLSLGDRKRILKAIGVSPTKAPDPGAIAPAAADQPFAAERRQITVVFCDLVGSSRLIASLDPEESREIIRTYRGIVAASITTLDGYVAQYLGDGVLAYFGWPTAHENSAIRAATAALNAAGAVAGYKPEHASQLSVRIGIATGLAVIGASESNPETEDFTAVGDVVNIAARLQQLAEPGSVMIAESTRSLLGSHFRVTEIGERELKGVGRINVFQVTEPDGQSGPPTVPSPTRAPTLLGREGEFQQVMLRWKQAQRASGQAVLVTGEAGIGKSHLTGALVQAIAETGAFVTRYFCSPFQMSAALHPIIQELRATAGISIGEEPSSSLARLEKLVVGEGGEPSECMAYLARLLSLPTEKFPEPEGVTPMIRKARTFAALTALISARTRRSPVLIVFEDAHWIDPTTLEFIDQLIASSRALPVMVVINGRLDFHPPWSGWVNFTSIPLQRLQDDQVKAVIERVSRGHPLPDVIAQRIAERSDGIPLFVEELTKAVIESGQTTEIGGLLELENPTAASSVPFSLRDTLMARLDRHPEAREIAQVAACIGRECDYEILSAVVGKNSDKLDEALAKLSKSEILFEEGEPPQSTYTFKHALVQEAARESLLNSRKRQIHLQIANFLETQRQDIVQARPELMAHHFTEAQVYEQAIAYRQKAANLALASSGNLEAIGELKAALELITLLPPSEARDRAELDILITQAIPYTLTKGYAAPEVETVYRRAMETCSRLAENTQSFAVIYGFWRFYLLRADYENALNLSEQLVRMASDSGDLAETVTCNRAAGATRFYTGRFGDALDHLGQTARIEPASDLRKAILAYDVVDPWVVNHAYSGLVMWIAGRPEEACQESDLAISLAREVNHPFTLALALCFAQWTYQFCGNSERVKELASEALALSDRYGFTFWTGWAEILLASAETGSDEAETRRRMRAGLATWQSTGSELGLSYFQCLLAEHSSGTDAQSLLDAAEHFAHERDEMFWLPEIHRLRGRLALGEDLVGGAVQAESSFRTALAQADALGAKSLALRTALDLARLLERRGDRSAASEALTQRIAPFAGAGSFADLDAARAALARAEQGRSLFEDEDAT